MIPMTKKTLIQMLKLKLAMSKIDITKAKIDRNVKKEKDKTQGGKLQIIFVMDLSNHVIFILEFIHVKWKKNTQKIHLKLKLNLS